MLPHPIEARLTWYSKLFMATLGIIVLNAGGVASLIAMQSRPKIFGSAYTLMHAGGLVFVIAVAMGAYFLYKVFQQIKLSEKYHDSSTK